MMNWTNVVESSRAVQVARAAAHGSIVVKRCHQLVGRLPLLGRDLQQTGAPADDGRVLLVIENSAMVLSLVTLLARANRARSGSRAAHALSRVRDQFTTQPTSQRVRLMMVMLFTAVVVHLALTMFNAPEPTVLARSIWVSILGLLVTGIACANGLAMAWPHRSVLRAENGSDIG